MEMPWWQWRVWALGVAAMTKCKLATKRKPGGTSQQPTAAAQSSPPQRSNQNKSNPILPTGQSQTDDANISVTAPIRPSACPARTPIITSDYWCQLSNCHTLSVCTVFYKSPKHRRRRLGALSAPCASRRP